MLEQIKKPGWARQGAAFLLGCAIAMSRYLLPTWMQPDAASVLESRRLPAPGVPSVMWVQPFWTTVNSLPWIGLLFLLFATFAIIGRNKKEGSLGALVAGITFLAVIQQALAF
jgi:hypothetical protein